MKFTDIVPILTALIAIIPALILALPTLTNIKFLIPKSHPRKSLPFPKDTSFEVLYVKREKLTKEQWKHLGKYYRKNMIISFIVCNICMQISTFFDGIVHLSLINNSDIKVYRNSLVYLFTVILLHGGDSYSKNINNTNTLFTPLFTHSLNIVMLMLPFLPIILALWYYILTFRNIQKYKSTQTTSPDNTELIRHSLFNEAKILFKADFEKLFDYIQLALIFMKVNVIEINFDEKTIEAIFRSITTYSLIKIIIGEQSENLYLLSISYSGDTFTCSPIINQLINIIAFDPKWEKISKPFEKPTNTEKKQTWLQRLLKK